MLLNTACSRTKSTSDIETDYKDTMRYLFTENPTVVNLRDCSIANSLYKKDSSVIANISQFKYRIEITYSGQANKCISYSFNDSTIIKTDNNQESYSVNYKRADMQSIIVDSISGFYHIIHNGSRSCMSDKLISFYVNDRLTSRIYYSDAPDRNNMLPDFSKTNALISLVLACDSLFVSQ